MSRALENMEKLLLATGLYNVEKPFISAELKAYSTGLDYLEELCEVFLNNLFTLSCDQTMLNKREQLFRGFTTDLTVEEKRNFILSRSKSYSSTKSGLEEALLSAGIVGNLIENYFDGIYVNIVELKGISKNSALIELEKILPVGVPIYTDFTGQSWGYLDSQDEAFQEIDNKDITWEQFDNIE